jgi:Na+(H+)/acetate symporter ActP
MNKTQVTKESYDKIKVMILSVIVALPVVFGILMNANNYFDLVKGVVLIAVIVVLCIIYRKFEPTIEATVNEEKTVEEPEKLVVEEKPTVEEKKEEEPVKKTVDKEEDPDAARKKKVQDMLDKKRVELKTKTENKDEKK